jgi:hypothetical protein
MGQYSVLEYRGQIPNMSDMIQSFNRAFPSHVNLPFVAIAFLILQAPPSSAQNARR